MGERYPGQITIGGKLPARYSNSSSANSIPPAQGRAVTTVTRSMPPTPLGCVGR